METEIKRRMILLLCVVGVLVPTGCKKKGASPARQAPPPVEADEEEADEEEAKEPAPKAPPVKKKGGQAAGIKAHATVPRYPAASGWGWKRYDILDGAYSVKWFKDPVLKEKKRSDHVSRRLRGVHKGSIYAVEIRDYSGQKDNDYKELSFQKFILNGWLKHTAGKKLADGETKITPGNISAYYASISYEISHVYFEDWLAFNVDQDVVIMTATSRPKFDASKRVEEFFNSFRINKKP